MGKSPGKWLRTVLLGKKSTRRSGSPKSATKGKECNWKEIPTLLAGALSQPESPTPAETIENVDLEPEMDAPSCSFVGENVLLPKTGDAGREGTASGPSGESEDPEREEAAVKIQAACRRYLARRAFCVLKRIIKLQAVVRGYLVRRQAVVTLYCILGVVQLQMLARGRKFPLAKEVHNLLRKRKGIHSFRNDKKSMKRKFPAQAFIHKLLSTTPVAMPIKIQYFNEEDNSAWNWLERWSSFHVWEPLSEPKKPSVLRSHVQLTAGGVQKQNPTEVGSLSSSMFSDSDKKHSPKRFTGSSVHVDQEKPQRKALKVRQNIRQIPNSGSQASGQANVRTEQPNHSVRRVSKPADDLELTEDVLKCMSRANKLPEDINVLATEDNNSMEDVLKCMSRAEEITEDAVVLATEIKAASLGNSSKYEPGIGVIKHVDIRNYVNLSVTEINANLDNGPKCGPNIGVRDAAEETNLVAALAAKNNAVFENGLKSMPDVGVSTTENTQAGMVCSPQRRHPSNHSSRSVNSMAESDMKKPPVKKFTGSSNKVVQEIPQNKQIKVTKKLTKASTSGTQAFCQAGPRTAQPKHGGRKLSGSVVDTGVADFSKQMTEKVVVSTDANSVLEDGSQPEPHFGVIESCELTGSGTVLVSNVNASLGCDLQCEPDVRRRDSSDEITEGVAILAKVTNAISVIDSKDDTENMSNPLIASKPSEVDVLLESSDCNMHEGGALSLQEFALYEKTSSGIQTCHENQKANKRRESSVSTKSAQHEINIPWKHPSHTSAAPVKAKKSQEQGSQDSSNNRNDSDSLKGRPSMPSSNSEKPKLHQVQRPVRKSTKGGPNAERLVQVEWKW